MGNKRSQRPGLGRVDVKDPSALQSIINRLVELVEVGGGLRPDRRYKQKIHLDQWITKRDLIDIGLMDSPDEISKSVLNPSASSSAPKPTPVRLSGLKITSSLFKNVLTWEKPTYDFFSYVEIWRSEFNQIGQAVMVGQAEDNVYEDEVNASGVLYYWIRAVSDQAVKGPFNTVEGTLASVAPVAVPTDVAVASGVAELDIAQDGTIITRAKMTFTLSTDTAIKNYITEYKKSVDSTWKAGPVVDENTTTIWFTDVLDGINHDFRIKAQRLNRDNSAWVTIEDHTIIGKTAKPGDVTSFSGSQNGSAVIMQWDRVTDVDLKGYIIRYGPVGSSYADGTPLTEVASGTHITTASVPPGTWVFFIKAIDTTGNESSNATSFTLTVTEYNTPIFGDDEAPDWTGTLTNFVKHWTGVLLPKDQNLASSYTNFEMFDDWPNPYATCTYEAAEQNIGFDDDVRVWGSIASALCPGIESGVADPKLWIDYRKNADSYDGFELWTIGSVIARYFKQKLILTTAIGIAKITSFKPTIDKSTHTESKSGVTISVSGTTVVFDNQFHTTPVITAQAEGGTPLVVTVTSITTTGFVATVYNLSGTDVGGNITYLAEGT